MNQYTPPSTASYENFWTLHPVLSDIRTVAGQHLVTPWALLGVTMCRVLSAVPATVQLPPIIGAPASLNFFTAQVGPSGSSKSSTMGCSYRFIKVPGEAERVSLGSGEGLPMVFLEKQGRPAQLVRNSVAGVVYDVDEITTLSDLNGRSGTTILSVLRSAWSGGQLGSMNADPMRNRKVDAHDYRLCLVAGVQPARAGVLFDDAGAGLPQRFFWVPTVDPLMEDPDDDDREWAIVSLHLPPFRDALTQVKVCDRARKEIREAHIKRQKGVVSEALDGHLMLTRLKLATVLALICDRRLEVTDKWWEAALMLIEVSNQTRSWAYSGSWVERVEVARRDGDALGIRASWSDGRKVDETVARVSVKFVEALENGPAEGMTQGDLSKTVGPADRLNGLVERKDYVDESGNLRESSKHRSFVELAMDNLLDHGIIQAVGMTRKKTWIYQLSSKVAATVPTFEGDSE